MGKAVTQGIPPYLTHQPRWSPSHWEGAQRILPSSRRKATAQVVYPSDCRHAHPVLSGGHAAQAQAPACTTRFDDGRPEADAASSTPRGCVAESILTPHILVERVVSHGPPRPATKSKWLGPKQSEANPPTTRLGQQRVELRHARQAVPCWQQGRAVATERGEGMPARGNNSGPAAAPERVRHRAGQHRLRRIQLRRLAEDEVEVDPEEGAVLSQHDVVVVAITNACQAVAHYPHTN